MTRTATDNMTRRIVELESRFDDAENRSRRDNLIFYGISDTSSTETFAESEQLVIELCRDKLQINVNTREIERAHRLGRFSQHGCRPIIVKFSSHKTKSMILSKVAVLGRTSLPWFVTLGNICLHSRKTMECLTPSDLRHFLPVQSDTHSMNP